MIHAPTMGPIGLQPHGTIVRMINRDSATLAVGDVVRLSFDHTGNTFSLFPTSDSALRLSPLASVKKTDSGATNGDYGFIGVVYDLASGTGATGQEVMVQFGGIANVKCQADASQAITFGQKLHINDNDSFFGTLTNLASTSVTETVPAIAVSFGTLAADSSGLVPVLMPSDLVFGGVIA